MILMNLFVFNLLLYLIRYMTLLYTSLSFVLSIFITTFIITTIIFCILKKLNYLNPFLSYLTSFIKYANMFLVIVTVLVLLFSFLNLQFNNMNIYCKPEIEPFSNVNIDLILKNANIDSWIDKVGGAAVFILGLKASSTILEQAPYLPNIGLLGLLTSEIYATILPFRAGQNSMWTYSEVEIGAIRPEEINVTITLDGKNNHVVEQGKIEASYSKLDINCPSEKNEEQ